MKTENRLLKIINGYKTASTTNSSTTMEYNLVADLLRIYLSIFINTSGMVLSNIFYDWLDNFIILLLRSSVIRPGKILEMSYNPSFRRLAFGICETKLHLPLDKVWHHFLMWNQVYFLVSIEDDTMLWFVFLYLSWPVLVTFNFGIFLGMGKHYNKRYSFLVYHTPEVFNCGLERTLCCNE